MTAGTPTASLNKKIHFANKDGRPLIKLNLSRLDKKSQLVHQKTRNNKGYTGRDRPHYFYHFASPGPISICAHLFAKARQKTAGWRKRACMERHLVCSCHKRGTFICFLNFIHQRQTPMLLVTTWGSSEAE